MLNNILNIEGATQLSREQQRKIKGAETCHVLVTGANGFQQPYSISGVSGSESCDYAAGYFSGHYGSVTRCQYDCDSDGFSASWWIWED